jgi:uncharacterized alkaline shock family protein YloU
MSSSSATVGERGEKVSSRGPGMGILERLIVVLVPLAVAAGAAVVLLVTVGLIDEAQLGVFGPIVSQLTRAAGDSRWNRVAVAVVSVCVGALSALIALRALGAGSGAGPARDSGQRHILAMDEKGIVVVEAAGVSTVAAAAASRVAGVMNVEVKVVGRGASPVRLVVTARVSAAVELRRVGEEIRRRAAEAVQSLVGIDVREVVVKLDVVPLEELGRALQ